MAAAVGAYITAAIWFTSSTAFANRAVTLARIFTGIAPADAAPFVLAQLSGDRGDAAVPLVGAGAARARRRGGRSA